LVRLHAILLAAGTNYGVDNCSPVVVDPAGPCDRPNVRF
jgi:hypothetical protein